MVDADEGQLTRANNVLDATADPRAADGPKCKHVLIVDDNRDAADSLAMLLEYQGFSARIVNDGLSALQALAEDDAPDAVLLDIGLPGMDGYEVARRVRSDPRNERLTLIALSGWGQEEDRQRSESCGFDHHLVKPLDFSALSALLVGH